MDNVLLPVQDEQFDAAIENEEIVTEYSEDESAGKFSEMTKEELLSKLEELINDPSDVNAIRNDVEAVKSAFYKRNKSDIEAARREFVLQGGDPETFAIAPDNYEKRLKELVNAFREKRNQINSEMEKEKEINFQKKNELIEKLKALVEHNEENPNSYNEFTEIQRQWREIGAVAKEKVNDLWNRYHFEVESFYNLIKINKELRDMDLKKNLEIKTALCEEAEKLSLSEKVVEAFGELQLLHEKWRETGPVPKEVKDEIWDRFKQASTVINKAHQAYFEALIEQQTRNLALKEELCEKVVAVADAEYADRQAWNDATDQIVNIQKVWRTIGFAPKKDNNRIYERFRQECNRFFERKHLYFKSLKDKYEENLQKKIEICRQAQLLQQSEEWQKTTAELLKLQQEWKAAGHSASKESDKVWKEFRAACDHFFARKSEYYSQQEAAYGDRMKAKEAIIEHLRDFDPETCPDAFEHLKEVQRNWSESGHLPQKLQNKLYTQYKELIDERFKALKSRQQNQELNSFRQRFSEGGSKTDAAKERDLLQRKLQKLEADLSTLENNIGFFSKSKNADVLIREMESKIEQAKEKIALTKKKIALLISNDNQ